MMIIRFLELFYRPRGPPKHELTYNYVIEGDFQVDFTISLKYAIEMASKGQKLHKTHCFRASENPENSRRSAQNASKTSILHVEFAVAIVIKKASKITPKWPKKPKNRPQDGFKTALPEISNVSKL